MGVQVFFRLRCGKRIWSRWLAYEHRAWQEGVEHGLVSTDRHGRYYPGPLVWIEKGYRRYAKSRTIPMTVELDGRPLPSKFRDPFAPRD